MLADRCTPFPLLGRGYSRVPGNSQRHDPLLSSLAVYPVSGFAAHVPMSRCHGPLPDRAVSPDVAPPYLANVIRRATPLLARVEPGRRFQPSTTSLRLHLTAIRLRHDVPRLQVAVGLRRAGRGDAHADLEAAQARGIAGVGRRRADVGGDALALFGGHHEALAGRLHAAECATDLGPVPLARLARAVVCVVAISRHQAGVD